MNAIVHLIEFLSHPAMFGSMVFNVVVADFVQHPHVINGCSELFAEVWGPDRGVGVRSAFGAGSLPLGVAVEIEAVFELA